MNGDLRARIAVPCNLRQIRSDDLSIRQFIPVDLTEPGMREDVICAIPHVSIPLGGFALHQFEDEVCSIGLEWRPANERRTTRDLFVEYNRVMIGLVIGRKPGEHLEY